jgi:hypothetical protein
MILAMFFVEVGGNEGNPFTITWLRILCSLGLKLYCLTLVFGFIEGMQPHFLSQGFQQIRQSYATPAGQQQQGPSGVYFPQPVVPNAVEPPSTASNDQKDPSLA